MSRSIIVFSGNDPDYLSLVWHLARLARAGAQAPLMLDLTDVVHGTGDAYNRPTLRAFRISSPDVIMRLRLEADGLDVVTAKDAIAGLAGGATLLPTSAHDGIAESALSALISYARDPLPNTRRGIWRTLERKLRASGEDAFRAVTATLTVHPEVDSLYVANGRFPHQRGAIEAARARGVRVVFYEKGELPGSFWLEDHSTLDREATQGNVDNVLSSLSPEKALATGRDWMNARSSRGSASNIYSRFFEDTDHSGMEENPRERRKIVGLFTSSQDEFAALGPEWHVQSWSDQWEAFDHVLSHLEPFGYDFYLRVHPNFTSKSHASFLRERGNVLDLAARHPDLNVIWHDEQVNSYSLLSRTDVAIVWDSTIGLEASGRGVPAWELAASYYDLYADVHQWFGPQDDPTPEQFEFEVDTDRTHRFMAYLRLRDVALPADVLELRRELTPRSTRGAQLASLAASGGAPTAAAAAASVVDAARHRNFAINRMAARSFVERGRSVGR